MRSLYRHRQIGWTIIIVLGLAALFAAAAGLATLRPALLLVVAVTLLTGLLFSSLTIEVTANELVWFFGPGFLKRRVARSEIAKAEPAVATNGGGAGAFISRRTAGFIMSMGSRLSRSRRRTATSFRLGTDEPQALARALGFGRGKALREKNEPRVASLRAIRDRRAHRGGRLCAAHRASSAARREGRRQKRVACAGALSLLRLGAGSGRIGGQDRATHAPGEARALACRSTDLRRRRPRRLRLSRRRRMRDQRRARKISDAG